MIFDRAIKPHKNEAAAVGTVITGAGGWTTGGSLETGQSAAMKISAVNACVEAITNSISKLPIFIINSKNKEHINHPVLKILTERPNEAMTPSTYKKLIETNRLLCGNGYALIVRDPKNARPLELIPMQAQCCMPCFD
ncbi:MAG: phage portal protein, partial [Hydrogenoanaerobacterium sp.]